MLDDLKGKRALVTGSSTGIGAAVAMELGRLGVAVAIHGNKNAEAAEAVAKDDPRRGRHGGGRPRRCRGQRHGQAHRR